MMQTDKIVQAARACALKVLQQAEAQRLTVAPKRLSEWDMRAIGTEIRPALGHLLFMCQEIELMVADAYEHGASAAVESLKVDNTETLIARWNVYASKREKAMRWLGFVQGSVWSWNMASIDDLKKMNMPDAEAFV